MVGETRDDLKLVLRIWRYNIALARMSDKIKHGEALCDWLCGFIRIEVREYHQLFYRYRDGKELVLMCCTLDGHLGFHPVNV